MKAILKKIEVPKFEDYMLKHPIKMFFAESEESDEIYCFGTSIETQFCTKDEYNLEDGLSDKLIEEKLNYANSMIGKLFEINLYKFTIKELTNNKYIAIELLIPQYDDFDDFKTIEDYYIASYMTKEDVVINIKHNITLQGVQGLANGVLPDGSIEEITTGLFFPKTIKKKSFEIPYDKYQDLTSDRIINEITVNDIRKGRNLAYQIKDRDISKHDFDNLIHQIETYRSNVKIAKAANNSLRKRICFWEPKDIVDKLELPQNVISLFRDSIICGRLYPSDCNKADREYMEECEKILSEFIGENMEEEYFKNKWLEFRQSLRRKYSGKEIIRPI